MLDLLNRRKKPEGIGKYSLVLEGGGAKGAYQGGAIKALVELGIEIEAVVGTSIGALNGAMIAQGEFESLYDLWYYIKPTMLMSGDEKVLKSLINFDFDKGSMKDALSYLGQTIKDGGLDITPLKELIDERIDEDEIRASNVNFGLVTVSLTEFKTMEVFLDEIPKGKLKDYLLASAFLPVFKTEKLDGKTFLDGAFHDNFPIGMLIKNGYKNIVGIEIQGRGLRQKVDLTGCNVINIVPHESIGGTLEITEERSRHNLNLGYYDTMRIFKKLRGRRYYIESDLTERDIIKKLLNLIEFSQEESLMEYLGHLYGSNEKSVYRILFEAVIPQIAEALKLPKLSGYDDVLVGLLEYAAEAHGIERFKIYNLTEFIELIASVREDEINCLEYKEHKDHEAFRKILRSTRLYLYSNKDKVLMKTVDAFLKEMRKKE